MAEPYVAEIRLFSFAFAPKGWAMCNGRMISISQNTALFSLLGTMYGGNGTSNFALPNAQSRVLADAGNTFTQGALLGEQAHTLTLAETPAHSHSVAVGVASGTLLTPQSNAFGVPAVNSRLQNIYSTASNGTANAAMVANDGGTQPHANIQPYLVMNYCIALQGIFPSRN